MKSKNKQIEIYPIFINRNTQHCQDGSSSQIDLENQGNPNQNLSRLFYGCQQTESKVGVERQYDPE